MTTGCPQSSDIFWPMRRVSTSEGPPAGKGTTILMERLGNASTASCAAAAAAERRSASMVDTIRAATRFIRSFLRDRCKPMLDTIAGELQAPSAQIDVIHARRKEDPCWRPPHRDT